MGKPTVRRNTVIYWINLFSTDYLPVARDLPVHVGYNVMDEGERRRAVNEEARIPGSKREQ